MNSTVHQESMDTGSFCGSCGYDNTYSWAPDPDAYARRPFPGTCRWMAGVCAEPVKTLKTCEIIYSR